MLIPKALTIAGSDSGGGAGIQADLKTFSAFRVFGMSIIDAVAATLLERPVEKLVVDPVMVAKSGDPLLQPDARKALADRILPLALVVTPNLPEAEALAGIPVTGRSDMEEAARRIHLLGPRYVLVKGGHLKGDDAVDLLWNGRSFTEFTAPRVDSPNTHGTGCTFSAAIAAGLARGQALGDSIRSAKAYVTRAIREGFTAGHGVGQLRHFLPEW